MIERDLRRLTRAINPVAEIFFERVAVTPEQIRAWNLPTRPTKAEDPRTKTWHGDQSVELDAIEPCRLRDLVRETIEQHLPSDQLERLLLIEQAERERMVAPTAGLAVWWRRISHHPRTDRCAVMVVRLPCPISRSHRSRLASDQEV